MIYLFFSIAMACTSSQEFSIRCKERCSLKGKDFVVKNDKCGCIDLEEVGKEVFIVNTNLRGRSVIDQKKKWDDE